MKKDHDARLAALSILNCSNCMKLLRAHGLTDHANNLEAALDALTELLSSELGRERLADAMDWASNELWSDDLSSDGSPVLQ